MVGDYVGTELGLFATAVNWKSYIAHLLRPFVAGQVLDVGAGLGSNIGYLINPSVTAWTALEPDATLAGSIATNAPTAARDRLAVVTGTLAAIPSDRRFDSILYLDVLEHIEDDRTELQLASSMVAPGGRLIILVPAHQALFSPFDTAIGHFRRYNLPQLRALTPPGFRPVKALMLDSVGFFASLANRFVLRPAMPSQAQIATWDRMMVPLSSVLDPLTLFRFGKSAVVVWQAR